MSQYDQGSEISTESSGSSSTVPGIGSLSGRAIKRVGSVVVNGVDAILIRRRLAQIETIFGHRSDGSPKSHDAESLYSDLLELSRPLYSLSIRTRAFRLIMGKLGGMDFNDLATAVVNWHPIESFDLLREMILSLRLQGTSPDTSLVENYSAFHAAGLDAYKIALPYSSAEKSTQGIAFLLYIGLAISLSRKPSFSRAVMDVGTLQFIADLYPNMLDPNFHSKNQLHPAQLVLRALLEKLDPIQDAPSVDRLLRLLHVKPPSSPPTGQTTTSFLMNVPMIDLLAQKLRSIHIDEGLIYSPGCGNIISRFLVLNGRHDIRVPYPTYSIDEQQMENLINEIYDTYLVPSNPPIRIRVSVSVEQYNR
ncbi:hypothetical protein BDP27DRAFT_1317696 [Rhodocollybia butyracea]|uniref:Uncharacterized protein n=1 Tax=Rhodocollybia butyracea TaxID=206335 RepID=A0A9P5Q3G4_9AGAR|nr:hypothetical protein BDP27DRAFT_1317696 [Rhodocollybia butyracea]